MLGPLLFRLFVSLAVTGAAGGAHVWQHPTFIVFLALEAVWSLSEGFFSRSGRRSARSWQSVDPRQIPWILIGKRFVMARIVYHVALFAYFGRVGSVTAAPASPTAIVGATLMIVAILLRTWSMLTLGERFRGHEVRAEDQGLETRGPYALVRHPSYLAFILFDLGMPLLLNSIVLLPLIFILLVVLIQRVSAEEALLENAYPVDYPPYVAKTWRMVPRVY